MNKGKSALTGAASGAAAGAVLGPWGAAGGALIGGLAGYFGADDSKAPTYTPDHQNFIYGLGPSDSYANQQSKAYDARQGQLAALGADAYNRQAPTQALPGHIDQAQSGGQAYLTGADAQARQQQLAALGGMQNATGAIQQFAQRPEGPSAAQAQLQAGTDFAAKQQYGFARAQPGGGGSALRTAAMNAAGISGNAANQAAMLRAQETANYHQQQLAALGAAQQGAGQIGGFTGAMRTQDQGMAQAQAGQANYDAGATNQFNQGQQQLQFNVGANNLNSQLTTRQQGDAVALAAGAQSQGYDALRNQVAGANTQQNNNYEAAKLQGAGLGAANFNAATQQGNAETGMTLGALSGAAGTYAQMTGGGNGNKPPQVTSDVRAKTDIKPTSVLAALGGGHGGNTIPPDVAQQIEAAHAANARGDFDSNTREFNPAHPAGFGINQDRQARLHALLGTHDGGPAPAPQPSPLDGAYQGGNLPETEYPNLRPAQGYEYAYKDPAQHGGGRYVGPMAQDLEHLPGVVEQGKDGQKAINAPRLTLANTAALSEMQRKQDELERQQQLQALGGPQSFARPNLQQPDYAAFGPAGYHY